MRGSDMRSGELFSFCHWAFGGKGGGSSVSGVMLLWTTAVGHHRFQPGAVDGVYRDDDSLAHSPDSHASEPQGILKGTQSSDCLH